MFQEFSAVCHFGPSAQCSAHAVAGNQLHKEVAAMDFGALPPEINSGRMCTTYDFDGTRHHHTSTA
jgi:hypothetical protein